MCYQNMKKSNEGLDVKIFSLVCMVHWVSCRYSRDRDLGCSLDLNFVNGLSFLKKVQQEIKV